VLLGNALTRQSLRDQLLPFPESPAGGIACLCAALSFERRGEDRAAGAEVAVAEDLGVELAEQPDGRGRVALLERRAQLAASTQ